MVREILAPQRRRDLTTPAANAPGRTPSPGSHLLGYFILVGSNTNLSTGVISTFFRVSNDPCSPSGG